MANYEIEYTGTLLIEADDEEQAEFFAKEQLDDLFGAEIVEVRLIKNGD